MELNEAVVSFRHVSMQFPGVLANDDICLDITPGEVFALVGENGAGKSTLMKILYGLNRPTDGEVYIKGKLARKFTPSEAIALGVGMVHQHFMLVPSFTVAQNITLSREPVRGLLFDNKKAESITMDLAREYGLAVEPSARVNQISVGLQQRVEILKTLYRGADILILDEPTAVLTPNETEELFAVVRSIVKEKKVTVIIITHKLYEVMAISDRVGVMRAGRLVGVEKTRDVNERILASMMVGRDVLFDTLPKTGAPGKVMVEVQDLRAVNDRGLLALNGVSFALRAGEILGVAGVEGNGQSELADVITGLREAVSGRVVVDGHQVAARVSRGGKTTQVKRSPGQIRRLGLAHIPEDRLATGVAKDAAVWENIIAGKQRLPRFSVKGFHLKFGAIRQYVKEVFDRFDVRAPSIDVPVGSLSGGNMQKVVVAREFSAGAPVLVVSQPTRGVDIGAIESIHSLIIQKRNQGCAILLISADLDELFRLSDRIITLFEGRITGEFAAGSVDKAEIGYYMTVKEVAP